MYRNHLRRLEHVWVRDPVYFITTCTQHRQQVLASRSVFEILLEEWRGARGRHRWLIGRYMVMPDHVHFFTRADDEGRSLERMMNKWKEWTAKRCQPILEFPAPLWQARFFDHVIRSPRSHE
jgi:REP element-mobilizing transposase RayT